MLHTSAAEQWKVYNALKALRQTLDMKLLRLFACLGEGRLCVSSRI